MPGTEDQVDNQPNQTAPESSNNGSSQPNKNLPQITLPTGGGSISSIGEKFQANPVTGTGGSSIPLPISPGRNGFTPALSLQYDSGNGNGAFGIGWNVGISSIVRKTQKGLPKYKDNDESDIFILAGSEDLVPALELQGNEWVPIARTEGNASIKQYRPRTEGLFAKIEKRTDKLTAAVHWQVTTPDNITTVYGLSQNSRVFDSEQPERIFEWMIEYTYDEKGNITLYEYKNESSDNIPQNSLSEKNRLLNSTSFNKKYIKSVKYNPDIPYNQTNTTFFSTVKWNFNLVFDYGEHDQNSPTINEANTWPMRQDPFSSFRSGFEIRTYRLCKRVLMFHFFENDLGNLPVLVKATDISYHENPTLSQIIEITQKCYKSGEIPEIFPPINFQYTQATIDPNIHSYAVSDIDNLPTGVDGNQYRWIDLLGEGLQGVLIEDKNAWYFKENLGDENYYKDIPVNTIPAPEARLSPVRKIAETPSISNLNNGTQQLTDLDGNGTIDLVINNGVTSGYYSHNKNNKWDNFIPFDNFPNIDFNDPNVRIMDINGDGFPDIIMTEENCFTIYHSEGKKGFSPRYQTLKSFDEEQGPTIIFSDTEQSVYSSDMTGDGLPDIMSVKNGSICYWPNMGYGKFGTKVSMDNAPLFDYAEKFNQQQVRLADINGTGAADILYITDDDIRYYPNHSGNGFGDPVVINERLPTHNLTSITALDILGNGTQCLVWSSPIPGDHPTAIKFIDLMGGIKPYLMTEMNNNMGSLTRLKYAPSTKFYLRDKRNGNPWVTKLPFPVQVVEQVEFYDEIGHNRFVTKYAYHHGYFDGEEREFRGFGMVEQTDSETFTDFVEGGLFPPGVNASEEVLHVPPVLTKTWFHTGFYRDEDKILGQYEKEYWNGDSQAINLGHSLPSYTSYAENREAARALRGSPLRQEVYSQDGSALETNPYAVTENNYALTQVQPRAEANRRDRDYGVYLVTPSETVSSQYERNPADPRISQQLTLETNEYGHVLQSAAVVYPRRTSIGYDEQDQILVTINEASIINVADNADFYRLGIPSETKVFEAHDLPAPDQGIYQVKELKQHVDQLRIIPFDQVKKEKHRQYHLSFNGTSSYIAVENLFYDTANSLPQLTIEAWVKTSYSGSSFNNNWAIFDLDRSDFFNFYVRGDGKVGFSTAANGSSIHDMSGTQVVNDGTWHHLAAVYDGTDKIIYVDGVEDQRITNPHAGLAIGKNTTRYAIIGDGSEASSFDGNKNNIFYEGELSEIRYWEVARSAQEIANNYTKQLTGTETALKLYYPIREGDGITTTDATGNGYNGVLRNMENGWIPDGPELVLIETVSTNTPDIYGLDFNGTSSYVAVKDLFYNQANSLSELTIETWVNTSFSGGSYNSNWAIFDLDRSDFFNFYVRGDGKVGFSSFAQGNSVDDMEGVQVVNNGQWHHVAAVYNGTDKIIYVDGVEDARVINAHNGLAIGKNSTRYVIIGDGSEATGFDGTRNNKYFEGMLSELRYWDVARSAQDIADSLGSRLMGDELGLQLYYDMTEGHGQMLNDRSANGYDGYLRNMTDSWGLIEIPLQATGTKRILQHQQVRYYDEGMTASLPLGEVASHGLPYESHQLALTAGLIQNTLNENNVRVDDTLLAEGQYVDLLDDGDFWIPSGRTEYDATRFFLPTAQIDPFNNQTTFAFDSYDLLLTSTTDALSNISAAQYDYRILQPNLVTDPNDNQQAFEFDVRGMVSAVAVMGKVADTDGDTLADPTSSFQYDLFRWMNEQEPNFAYTKMREAHGAGNTRFIESYAYSNGLGQAIMTKNKVADGLAYGRNVNGELLREINDSLSDPIQSSPRWVGSGRTILDNKGNPIKQYEPYFSSTSAYESETELVEYGVTPIIKYDPLGRAIRTDLPDDTITRVEFTPWEQKNYDQNDTVLESLWYIQRNAPDPLGIEPTNANERAAWLAAKHADTPQIIHIDNLGRPFITIDDNGTDGLYSVTTKLDIKGNPLQITDAKGRNSFTYTYNLLNQPIKTTHLDHGIRYALGNAIGNPLMAWDDRDQLFISQYDELQRPTHIWLHAFVSGTIPGSTGGPAINTGTLLSFNLYGEKATAPKTLNLRGQVYLTFDSAGMTKSSLFDFKGNTIQSERQLAVAYQTSPDWVTLDGISSVTTVLTTAAALLESETFTVTNSYDALNRPVSITQPDNSVINPGYDEAGQLKTVSTHLRGAGTATDFVTDILYNVRGQRDKIVYANGSQTAYHYDTHTFRLTQLLTTRNIGADTLQNLNYFYDPVGNITEMTDGAQQTHFYDNTEVSPSGKYTYDALSRLISSEGRELIGLNTAPDNNDTSIAPLPNNTTAMRLYTQQYEYDALGNIMKMIHTATAGSWTRHYHYAANNYLLSNSTDGIKPTLDQYTYDAHGNMTAMPHLATMGWDYADRLQSADLGGGGAVYYAYDAAGDRVRKVIENGNIKEERIYLGDWEIYRKTVSGTLDVERETLHISDDTGRIALTDTLTVDGGSAVTTPTPLIRYQMSNHLGSASLELDDAAAIISYEEYYPFGTTSYRSGRNSAETSLKRYRYVGKERDDETGLYYYGARYYAAWLARFVSVDPLKDDYPQLNPYNYADNSPVSDKDIDGRQNFNTEVRRQGITQPSDATTHVAGQNARLKFQNRSIPISQAKPGFIEKQASAIFNQASTFATGLRNTFTTHLPQSLGFEGAKPAQVLTTEGFKDFGSAEHNRVIRGSAEVIGNDVIEASKIAAAGVAGEILGFASISAPFIENFVLNATQDIVTQAISKAIINIKEGNEYILRTDDIDVANSIVKGIFGNFSKKNSLFVPVEEGLKALLDGTVSDPTKFKDLSNKKELELAFAEFGLSIAFKFIPGGSTKEKFGENTNNPITEITIGVLKTIESKEIKKSFLDSNPDN